MRTWMMTLIAASVAASLATPGSAAQKTIRHGYGTPSYGGTETSHARASSASNERGEKNLDASRFGSITIAVPSH
jgi:hypothetical protein